jgi:diguanylate cyclase (GGDEF)-like protein
VRQLKAAVEQALRAGDVVTRHGSGELAIFTRERMRGDPLLLGERIRNLVEMTLFCQGGTRVSPTVSVGVAALTDGDEPSFDQLMHVAEAGLAAARASGSNCCRHFARY